MKAHKEHRFLRGRQIAYLIYEYFRVTGAKDSVENYADLFTIGLRNDDIQEFDSKWDEILLSMTKIPSDDILEGLYKPRIRESEKLETAPELHKKGDSAGESRTWLSQIEDNGEKEYRAESTNEELWSQKWKFWNKRRGHESDGKTAWTKKSRRLLALESQRAVFQRGQVEFPTQYKQACKNNAAESFSEFFHAAEWEKCLENPKSQRKKSQW